jgi:hypothetical protein
MTDVALARSAAASKVVSAAELLKAAPNKAAMEESITRVFWFISSKFFQLDNNGGTYLASNSSKN